MSVEKRVTFSPGYEEPIVTITIKGWDDAFRFAWAISHLQCEFVDLGRRIGGSLRRKLGAKRFREYHQRFTSGSVNWARDVTFPDELGLEVSRKQVVDALQLAWNDFCADTGCYPDCITQNGRRLTADFSVGNFAEFVTGCLNNSIGETEPDKRPKNPRLDT